MTKAKLQIHISLVIQLTALGALLHEIRLNINHSGYHRHSAYIMQNSNLPEFNQKQQLIIATLVRFHRKNLKLEEIPDFTLYKKKQLLPFIQLLRLGTLLNNQRQATTMPASLILEPNYNHWTPHFPEKWFSKNALALLDLEREKQDWNTVIGWDLVMADPSCLANGASYAALPNHEHKPYMIIFIVWLISLNLHVHYFLIGRNQLVTYLNSHLQRY